MSICPHPKTVSVWRCDECMEARRQRERATRWDSVLRHGRVRIDPVRDGWDDGDPTWYNLTAAQVRSMVEVAAAT